MNLLDPNDFSTIVLPTGPVGKPLDDLIARLVARGALQPEPREAVAHRSFKTALPQKP